MVDGEGEEIVITIFPSEAEEMAEAEQMSEPQIDVYLRVFTGTVDVAESVLQDMGDDFFAPAVYLGSASLSYEPDTNVKDQCHMLIGLRGTPDEVSDQVEHVMGFIKEQTSVDATIQQLVVEDLIVSRTLSAGDLDLFDEE